METTRTGRRFVLADVMCLVLASAVGFALYRMYIDDMNRLPPVLRQSRRGSIDRWVYGATPIFVAVPLGLLASRMIPPRPSRRRLFRSPGTVACLAVVFYLAVQLLPLLIRVLINPRPSRGPFGLLLRPMTGYVWSAPPLVAFAWLLLLLNRPRAPLPDWVERAGRLYGLVFIVLWLILSFT